MRREFATAAYTESYLAAFFYARGGTLRISHAGRQMVDRKTNCAATTTTTKPEKNNNNNNKTHGWSILCAEYLNFVTILSEDVCRAGDININCT